MPTGTVKWFNNAKGYGFILPDDGGDDLFAHYSSIDMEGYKTLKAGQPVTFDVVQGAKGLHATNIQLPNRHNKPDTASQTESANGSLVAEETAKEPASAVAADQPATDSRSPEAASHY